MIYKYIYKNNKYYINDKKRLEVKTECTFCFFLNNKSCQNGFLVLNSFGNRLAFYSNCIVILLKVFLKNRLDSFK